jgi:hypothetical protein
MIKIIDVIIKTETILIIELKMMFPMTYMDIKGKHNTNIKKIRLKVKTIF